MTLAMTQRTPHARDRARTEELMQAVNHELRSTLTTIVGYTELLRGGEAGELDDVQQRMLDRVGASAEHLQFLVEALLATAMSELEAHGRADVLDVVRVVLGDGLGVDAGPDVEAHAWLVERLPTLAR